MGESRSKESVFLTQADRLRDKYDPPRPQAAAGAWILLGVVVAAIVAAIFESRSRRKRNEGVFPRR